MMILLTAATRAEIQPTLDFIERLPAAQAAQIEVLITGVGGLHTAHQLAMRLHPLQTNVPTLALQAGIAGSWRKDWALGQVVQVVSEYNADLGAQTADGGFLPLAEMGFMDISDPVFDVYSADGRLWQSSPIGDFLPRAHSTSVNAVHGEKESIRRSAERLAWADIETMEGSAFFYACLQYQKLQPNFKFVALRSLSNYVEERNRERWQISQAIATLNGVLIEMLEMCVSE